MPLRPRARGGGVDLGHDERDVGVHPERAGVVDGDRAARGGDRRPLRPRPRRARRTSRRRRRRSTPRTSATTSTSSPRTWSRLPADRADAISRISPHTSSRVESRSSITVPTAPVAPTTARVGLRSVIVRSLRRRSRPALRRRRARTRCARPRPPRGTSSSRQITEMRISEVEISSMLTPASASAPKNVAETPGCERMPGADQRDLADLVVVEQVLEADLVLDLARARSSPPARRSWAA